MPDDLVVGRLIVPGSDLEERFETSGGPGGQHANRTASTVIVRLDIASSSLAESVKRRLSERYGAAVTAKASESRSQSRNRALARERLAERIGLALRPEKKRTATKPSRAAKESRLSEKKARGEVKKSRRNPGLDD